MTVKRIIKTIKTSIKTIKMTIKKIVKRTVKIIIKVAIMNIRTFKTNINMTIKTIKIIFGFDKMTLFYS